MRDGGETLKTSPGRLKKTNSFFVSYWGIWLILGVLFIFFAMKMTEETSPVREELEAAEPHDATESGERRYVGAERCRDCHWREYDTWKNTLHSKFFQPSSTRTVIGDFERNNTLTLKVTDNAPKFPGREVTSTMFKKDGKYYVKTVGPDWENAEFEIMHVIGIGRRQNYLTEFPNGEMHVLPVEWDVQTRTWINVNGLANTFPGQGDFWSDTGQIWQLKCGGCHVTGISINYDEIKDSYDTTWSDRGIACEACHGPGSEHVRAASVYFEGEKDTIINPAKLPWRLRAMVCGQCHNWGLSTVETLHQKEGAPRHYSFPYGYKPGEALYLYYDNAPYGGKIHHQQYNEWQESEHAKVGLMCTNCHNVHQKEDIKVAMTKLTPDSLCMDCHKTLQRRAAHRIHTFGSCVACHMPKTVEHEHSHTFKFLSPELSLRAGGVDKQPNSCSGCHHHKETPLENLVGFLDAAKKEDMPKPFNAHRMTKPVSE